MAPVLPQTAEAHVAVDGFRARVGVLAEDNRCCIGCWKPELRAQTTGQHSCTTAAAAGSPELTFLDFLVSTTSSAALSGFRFDITISVRGMKRRTLCWASSSRAARLIGAGGAPGDERNRDGRRVEIVRRTGLVGCAGYWGCGLVGFTLHSIGLSPHTQCRVRGCHSSDMYKHAASWGTCIYNHDKPCTSEPQSQAEQGLRGLVGD